MAAARAADEAATRRETADSVSDPRPSPGVQVWAVDVSCFSLWAGSRQSDNDKGAALIDTLINDEGERARVKRYVREIDQIRSLAGKLLVRLAITARFSGTQWHDLRFKTTKHGRPYLSQPALPVDFNITHDGDWVALTLTSTSDAPETTGPQCDREQEAPVIGDTVGTDVMEIHLPHFEKSVDDFVETMDITLTARERAWILNSDDATGGSLAEPLPPHDDHILPANVVSDGQSPLDAVAAARLRRLYVLWTHKEALTKACGIGLGFDFAHLEIAMWEQALHDGVPLRIVSGSPGSSKNSVGSGVVTTDVLALYSFLAIALPPGRLGGRRSRLAAGRNMFPGAGTGEPSLLVAAIPRKYLEQQQQQQRPMTTTSTADAESSGLLRRCTMDDLVKAAQDNGA